MRRIATLLCITVTFCVLAGCNRGGKRKPPAVDFKPDKREFLVIDFKPDTTMRYKLTSQRNITLELKSDNPKMKGRDKPQTMSEKLELVIAYNPVEVDPFGLTTIEGKCESAKVTRKTFTSRAAPKDAAEHLVGRTFTIQLSPTGKIADYSSLTKVVRELGKKAFASNKSGRQRTKDPDMIHDFMAMQWHLWDSVATIKEPLKGVGKGDSWKTSQLVPLPIPIIAVRDTTYTFGEVTETPDGRKAVINSEYVLSDEKLKNCPTPYSGSFAMKGMFGFLRNYKYLSLVGQGKQIFNIDAGVVESDQQQYKMTIGAAFMLPLGDTVPVITIDQKISIELLDNER